MALLAKPRDAEVKIKADQALRAGGWASIGGSPQAVSLGYRQSGIATECNI